MDIEKRLRLKKEEELPEPSRRHFLQGATALTGLAITGTALLGNEFLRQPHGERAFSQVFDLGPLKGKHATGLEANYLGHPKGPLPERMQISFPDNMRFMWRQKNEYAAGSLSPEKEAELADFSRDKVESYEEAWENGDKAIGVPDVPFEAAGTPYFDHVLDSFSKNERALLKALDWEKVREHYNLGDKWNDDMLAYLASRATGRAIMAYSMTEIMPYSGEAAKENIELYNFLLKNAGAEFILRIPSLYDALISYGPLQFTHLAIDLLTKKGGLNSMLPREFRIPDRIEDFKTLEDHSRAALLFGLHNLAIAISSLRSEASDASIEKVASMDDETFASLLAAHHYRPSDAHRALIAWAKDDSNRPYYEFCSDKVQIYAKRSYNNCVAINAHFSA